MQSVNHGWRLPSLLSWSAVGWLVWAKRLGNVWLTIGWWETVDSTIDLSLLIDWLHGWRLPFLLSWSAVGWLVWAKRLGNVWLTIGWWETVDSKIDLSLLIDWLHGWRLPSLLSWSAVGWLVWAKRLGNVWLTIGWWETVDSKLTCLYWLTDCSKDKSIFESTVSHQPIVSQTLPSLFAQTNQPTADQLSKKGSRQPCSQSISKDKSILSLRSPTNQ